MQVSGMVTSQYHEILPGINHSSPPYPQCTNRICKRELFNRNARSHPRRKGKEPMDQAFVPTPLFRSEPFLCSFSALNFFHSAAISSFESFFSVIRFFSHLFSVSNWLIRPSNAATLSLISFADRSSACSLCFFLTRNRAEAAVFRRRLSSSAASRDASSNDCASEGEVEMESDYLLVPDGAVADVGDPAAGDEAYRAWPGWTVGCRLGSVKLPGT